MEPRYKRTLYASYIGYITQAINNNLAPLLFVIFQREFHISVGQIGFLVTYNFSVQICIDLFAARFAVRIGYKKCMIFAHIMSVIGLIGLGVFPGLMDPYAGLLLAVTVYALGGGFLEVLVSPIVEALPTTDKSGIMSLLHSFYCWGHALVVILTTVFFQLAGTDNWRIICCLWAIVPLANIFLYASSPILVVSEEADKEPMGKLFSMKLFWLLAVMMLCSGASEQAMSQWASFFAETGLQVSKTLGDILGPCLFAILMGTSRTFYAAKSERIPLEKFIVCSSILCVVSYLIAVFSPFPVLALVGCAMCGLGVGIMWPGVFSLITRHCPQASTAMFALLALAGDLGCGLGPSVVGTVSELTGKGLQSGLLAAVLFPTVLILGVRLLTKRKTNALNT